MSYTKTTWRNNQAPAINADNLNHMEQGIESAHNQIDVNTSNIESLTTQVQNNATNIASEISARQTTDSSLQSQIDQLVAPTGEAPTPAEIENARIGDDGVTYDTLGNAIRGQFSDLKSEISEVLDDNILFQSASETVTGSGTYVNKNIDITDGIVAGQKYTLKIGSIVGGTSSYLVYLRTVDANNTIIENQSSGSATTNATCSITATAETAKLRITLYPATTTPMPTGEATYSDITLVAGTSVEYEINNDIPYERMDAVEYKADKAVPFVTGKNIFDGHNSNSLTDTLVTENGAVTSNSSFSSVFLPIDGGKNIVCNFAYSRYSFYTSYNDISKLSVGDTLKGYISGVIPTSVGQVVAVPASARYICVGYTEDRIDTMQIEYGTTVTTFEKFYKGVPEAEIIPLKPTVISVYADGTGDYANLRLALESITDSAYNKPYEVHIYEGTYDIASLFTAEEIAQQSNQGLFVPNYVTLVGVGNRDDIKLVCTLSTSNQYFSPLHFRNYGGMKNITVDATKCRYVVHDDIAVNGLGSERLVENCKFIGHSLYYVCVYGSGMKEDSHWTFKDCVFDASEAGASNASGIAFLSHNSLDWIKPSELIIQNCRMINTPTESSPNSYAMRFRTLNQSDGHSANNMPIYIHLYGNLCNGIELREDESGSYGTGILTYVDGFYNKNAYEHITTAGTAIPTSERFNLI